MNNHREQFTIGTKYPINALNPCLSIKEDFIGYLKEDASRR